MNELLFISTCFAKFCINGSSLVAKITLDLLEFHQTLGRYFDTYHVVVLDSLRTIVVLTTSAQNQAILSSNATLYANFLVNIALGYRPYESFPLVVSSNIQTLYPQ